MHSLAFFSKQKLLSSTLLDQYWDLERSNKISFSWKSLKFSYLPFSDPLKDGLLLFCAIPSNFLSIKEVITSRSNDLSEISAYRIAGNFRWFLISAISRIVYGVAKIKTAIIYPNRNSFKIANIYINRKNYFTHFYLKSRKFSYTKISRYTVLPIRNEKFVIRK